MGELEIAVLEQKAKELLAKGDKKEADKVFRLLKRIKQADLDANED